MSITFKDLENFLITSDSPTLSEASEKLGMAQPSLSIGIKKLETELGYPLFFRTHEGIRLTPQGKGLRPLAENALKNLADIKGHRSNLKFKIGCHPSVGMYILGRFLKLMFQEDSKIDFEVVTDTSHQINKMVASGEVDFGIVMNPLSLQGLIIKTIGTDSVHVWESKKRYQDKLIFSPQMMQAHSILSRWKLAPKETIEVPNLELIAHLIHSGAGIGILPTQVVKAQNLDLRQVDNTPTFKDHLSLVCYPEMLKTKEGKFIFENLKKSFTH